MFYKRFLQKIYCKNEPIAHFRSFPLFWWAMWMNCSFSSNQMSDVSDSLRSLRRIWAIVSESLRSLIKNKWMSESLIFGQKKNNSPGNQMSEFPALSLTYYLIYLTHILADLPQSHTGWSTSLTYCLIYLTHILADLPHSLTGWSTSLTYWLIYLTHILADLRHSRIASTE